MMKLVRTALVLASMASAIACGGSTEPAQGAAAKPSSSGGWTTAATFNGDGGLDTTPFALSGGKVQFVFTVQPNSSGPVPFMWRMFKEGAPVGPLGLGENSCASCDGQQTQSLGTVPAGKYYLHILTSRPWTLRIEEQR